MGWARIGCLDLDTFFVSVERLHDPSLHGKPVVIGAAPGQRGVVTSASYEARELGIHAGMSATEARRLAPHAVYLPTRHGEYSELAAQVREILERYTPAVQAASIDEFYLDFRGCERLHHRATDPDADATIERVGWEMRDTIQAELGLPASVGIGVTRSVAKVATGQAKPAGVHMVRAGLERAFLGPLHVKRFPGIGPVTQAKLAAAGIERLEQLLTLGPGPQRARFGGLAQHVLRCLEPRQSSTRERPAFREHDDPSQGIAGSISNERTFYADIGDVRRVEQQLQRLAERVCWRARQREVSGRTVTLKLRTNDFRTVTRSVTGPATHAERVVLTRLRTLLRRAWNGRTPVRLLGVGMSHFESAGRQLLLPLEGSVPGRPLRPAPAAAIDAVRARFGYDSIRLGSVGEGHTWLA